MAKRKFSIFLLPWLPTTCLPSSCSVNTPCHSIPFSSTQLCLRSSLFPYMHRHAGRASLLVPALFLFLPSLCTCWVHSSLCSLCTGTGFTLHSLGNFTLSHFPDYFLKKKKQKNPKTFIFSYLPFLSSWDLSPRCQSKLGTFLSHQRFLQAPNLVPWAPLAFLTQASVQSFPFFGELTLINLLSPPLPNITHHFTFASHRGHFRFLLLILWGQSSGWSLLQGAFNLVSRMLFLSFLSASYPLPCCFFAGLNLYSACWQLGTDA